MIFKKSVKPLAYCLTEVSGKRLVISVLSSSLILKTTTKELFLPLILEVRKQKLKELSELATVPYLIENCRVGIKLRFSSKRFNHL